MKQDRRYEAACQPQVLFFAPCGSQAPAGQTGGGDVQQPGPETLDNGGEPVGTGEIGGYSQALNQRKGGAADHPGDKTLGRRDPLTRQEPHPQGFEDFFDHRYQPGNEDEHEGYRPRLQQRLPGEVIHHLGIRRAAAELTGELVKLLDEIRLSANHEQGTGEHNDQKDCLDGGD